MDTWVHAANGCLRVIDWVEMCSTTGGAAERHSGLHWLARASLQQTEPEYCNGRMPWIPWRCLRLAGGCWQPPVLVVGLKHFIGDMQRWSSAPFWERVVAAVCRKSMKSEVLKSSRSLLSLRRLPRPATAMSILAQLAFCTGSWLPLPMAPVATIDYHQK